MNKTVIKTYLLSILFSSILTSCGDEPSETNSNKDDSKESELSEDSLDLNTTDYSGSATITMMVDGPDEELFVENFGDFDELSIHNFYTLDLIPYVYGADDAEQIYPEMKVIARDNFSVTYTGLENYTGSINLYYDTQKKHLASSFSVKEGMAEGNCTLYNTDGTVYIERVYLNGQWQYSGREPYAVDWTFDKGNASLIINDVNNGIKKGNLVEIMHSFHDDDYEYFDWIIEKETFNNIFTINGTAFTGKLVSYNHPTYYEATPKFELNFLDGYLQGDIKIYTWWGELELHETFENGIFVEEIYKMDESMMDGVAKPIIYLYPEEETVVTVNLNFDGHLTHTYPKYEHGWKVTALPDGTLLDENGKEYYALYWEGQENTPLEIPNGTILKGSESIAFLEKELPKMGLNARETNEFIIFWMPFLENNKYNLIHFASDRYEEIAQLNISPKPETLIRVMMVFQPLDTPIAIKQQNLSELYKERKGFTFVEWGGRRVNVAI